MRTRDFKLKELKTGDIVRHKGKGEAYVVTSNFGDRVTAVRTVDITNAPEWVLCEFDKERS